MSAKSRTVPGPSCQNKGLRALKAIWTDASAALVALKRRRSEEDECRTGSTVGYLVHAQLVALQDPHELRSAAEAL